MRYENKSDLPPTIRDVLPERAQELYLAAYQRAWDAYEQGQGYLSRDVMAHQQGWTAMRHEYTQDQGTGEWYRIGQKHAEEGDRQDFLARLIALFTGPG
jgi:cation transport regulator